VEQNIIDATSETADSGDMHIAGGYDTDTPQRFATPCLFSLSFHAFLQDSTSESYNKDLLFHFNLKNLLL
jgi:hypothetical protein